MYIYESIVAPTSVPGSSSAVIELPVPSMGVLQKLIVFQDTGTASGFTVSLYNNEEAANGTSTLNAALYKVLPDSTVSASGTTSTIFGFYPYANTDGDSSNRSRVLYLKIANAAVGAGTFSAAATIKAVLN